ncbi:MAG: prefoldin subunit [Candidatus Micrarchaeia archaeon]
MSNEMSSSLAELQELQSKIQATMIEKQQLMIQQSDIDRALQSLKEVQGKTYEMIGTILVERSKEDIEKGLLDRKQLIDLRLESLDKNERMFRSRMKAIAEKFEGMQKSQQGNERR